MVVDIIVGVILIGSAIISFLRGFIREILTIFGIVGGVIAAYIGGPLLIPQMSSWLGVKAGQEVPRLFDVVPYDLLAQILSYACVFLSFAIVLSIISHLLSEGASKIGLGALDRTLGVAFGLARGLLVLGVLYLPLLSFTGEETRQKWFEGSKTHVYVESTALWIGQLIPKEASEKLAETAKKAEEANDARKKLQDLGMIPGGQPQEAPAGQEQTKDLQGQNPPPTNKPGNNSGYSTEFRQKMNELVDTITPPAQEQPPAQNNQGTQNQ